MYFPGLEGLKTEFPSTIVTLFDSWLASLLPPRTRAIRPERFARDAKLTYPVAYDMFISACDHGVLGVNFEANCPECGSINLYPTAEVVPALVECREGHCYDTTGRPDLITVSFFLITPPARRPKKAFGPTHDSSRGPNTILTAVELSENDRFRNKFLDRYFFRITDQRQAESLLREFEASFSLTSTKVKGAALENLAKFLLECIPCFEVTSDHRSETNQLDHIVRVKPTLYPHPLLYKIGTHFVCECKNEAQPVGVEWVSKIKNLLDDHDATFGLFFSRMPIAGRGWHDANGRVRHCFIQSQKAIVCVDYNDIVGIIRDGNNLMNLLFDKYYELVLIERTVSSDAASE